MQFECVPFGELFARPQKNGLTRPKRVRGTGLPMVNMGELFAYPRIGHVRMDLVPVSSTEKDFLLSPGDLLFARQSLVRDGAGQCSIFLGNSSPTVFESHLIRCRLTPERAVPDFYFYFFRSPQGRVAIDAIIEQGAGAAGIRGSDLVRLPVPVPTLPEQRWVSDSLRALDDRIDLLRQTNATLESIAQTLFKSWFIDFDPVRAKAEGREPEGMDAATAALFPAEFEESALGLIPKGWRAGSLADLAALNDASWTARRAPAEVAYIDLTGVKANVFDPPQRVLFADAPSRARRELRAGDTLVGTVRPGNRSFGFIADTEPGLTGSTGFAVLSPLVPNAAAFVYLCATRDENIERLAALADGGAYPAVRPELVQATASVLPSANVLNAFHEVASPLLRGIAENTRHSRSLAGVRDSLLPRLISGKLRLPEAPALFDEVSA